MKSAATSIYSHTGLELCMAEEDDPLPSLLRLQVCSFTLLYALLGSQVLHQLSTSSTLILYFQIGSR